MIIIDITLTYVVQKWELPADNDINQTQVLDMIKMFAEVGKVGLRGRVQEKKR